MWNNRFKIRIIRDYIIGWTLALLFLCVIRGLGTKELGALQFSFELSVVLSLIVGPVFGAISGFIRIYSSEYFVKRISILELMGIRLLMSVLFLSGLIVVSYFVLDLFMDHEQSLFSFMFNVSSFPIYFYVIVVDFGMSVLSHISQLLGEDKLWEILSAKYYRPKKENRLFMFLDLKNSTQLAEKLGHIKYSRLLQECFNDLAVMSRYEAEIYQYVGDEAVLTWPENVKNRSLKSINAFFGFSERIQKKALYYQKEFEVMPEFRAGIHLGEVVVTEVGKYKKEIAFHGDPINTAARILDAAKKADQYLFISKEAMAEMEPALLNNYKVQNRGSFDLKGKSNQIELLSISV